MKTGYLRACIILAAFGGMMVSCSTSPTGPVAVPVDLSIRFKTTALTTLIDNAVLRIVYLGTADTLYENLTVAHAAIMDTLELRPGDGVQLYLTARSGGETVLYEGYDTINVVAGSQVVAEIDMWPVASILRPAPLYQEISLSGEQEAAVGVDLYRVTDLFGAAFRLEYDTTKVRVIRVEPGSFLGTDVIFFSYPQSGYVAVSVSRRESATHEVGGVSGSGRLATIVFSGVGTGVSPLRFNRERVSLTTPAGQAIAEMSQMFFESGEISVLP